MQETETAQQPFPLHEIIEELTRQLGEKYVFPEKAQEITANLCQHLEQGDYDGVRNGETLAWMITEHMREVSQDKHLNLFYRADGVAAFVDDNEIYTPEAIEHIRQKKHYNYGLKKVEILDGNIGYFQFDEFVHPHVAGESMNAAMTFLAHPRALIIDLRANGGGDATMVQFLCSYFFDAFEAHTSISTDFMIGGRNCYANIGPSLMFQAGVTWTGQSICSPAITPFPRQKNSPTTSSN